MHQARQLQPAWAPAPERRYAAVRPTNAGAAAAPLRAAPSPVAGSPRSLAQRRAVEGLAASPRALAQSLQTRPLQAPVLQCLTSVYSPEAYRDPQTWLKQHGTPGRGVSEEWGSAGIGSTIIQDLVQRLTGADFRDKVLGRLERQLNRLLVPGQDPNGEAPALGQVYADIKKISGARSAWDFVRQNTLALSKLGLASKVERTAPTQGYTGPNHTYHYDAGYAVVDETALSGGKKVAPLKASALNGPFDRGFVKGHQAIDNMKHRFVEHVHIDKEESDDKKVDIYNGSSADVKKAEDWPKTLGKNDKFLTPEGTDGTAVDEAVARRHEEEFRAFLAERHLAEHQDVPEEL